MYEFYFRIATWLPYKFMYAVCMRAFIEVTTDKWGNTDPNDVNFSVLFSRLEEKYEKENK